MAISGDNHWSSESRWQHWSEYELHGECLIKSRIYSSFASTWIQPRFLWVRVTHHLSFLCCVFCCFFFLIDLRSVSYDQICLCLWNAHSWLSPSLIRHSPCNSYSDQCCQRLSEDQWLSPDIAINKADRYEICSIIFY
jgi:hypothetical protein